MCRHKQRAGVSKGVTSNQICITFPFDIQQSRAKKKNSRDVKEFCVNDESFAFYVPYIISVRFCLT